MKKNEKKKETYQMPKRYRTTSLGRFRRRPSRFPRHRDGLCPGRRLTKQVVNVGKKSVVSKIIVSNSNMKINDIGIQVPAKSGTGSECRYYNRMGYLSSHSTCKNKGTFFFC